MGIRSGRLRFDEQVCGAFDWLNDTDEKKVFAYLRTAGLNAALPLQDILSNLEVLNVENGKAVMSNAGVLLFAKNPGHFLKSAPVVCAVYQNDDKAVILDRKIYDDGLLGNIEGALTYLKRHIDVRFEIQSLERNEIPGYPEAAVREAVVNAVMHRDYFDVSGDIMVEVFRNRIVVSNPGGLVSWLRPEDFGKYSRTRNRLIASMLMRTPYAEKMGTGILRIGQALKDAGLPEAEFSYDEFSFSVSLFASRPAAFSSRKGSQKTSQKGSQKTSQKILEAMGNNPEITIAELSERCGVSTRSIQNNINKLKKLKRLRREGPDKGGCWKVLDVENVQ
ncbi:MAG: winged helix-turn-helix transcriptional regulator [Bacteroidia bacterium]|nr:winged helix-turn-helix transcriptional regulator [Bacteroidia bacterium]